MSHHDLARLILEATVSPSEDPAKVAEAVSRVVGASQGSVSVGPGTVRLVSDDPKDLTRIRDQLRDRHVRGAARRRLLLNKTGHATSMMLNRQAAAAGVVAVCGTPEESPLGPIYLTISSRGIDGVIDWLTAYADG